MSILGEFGLMLVHLDQTGAIQRSAQRFHQDLELQTNLNSVVSLHVLPVSLGSLLLRRLPPTIQRHISGVRLTGPSKYERVLLL